jgi:hypothetical protein
VTLLLTWPVLLGRSTSAVPGLQGQLWPWRGVVDTGPGPALQADGAASSYPWSVTYHQALRHLELPFWDWHSFSGGYDLASDGVSGVMYPVHWVLWLLLEPPHAHDAYVVLHLWVGGLVTYLLLRHWRLAAGPALVGATTWMLAPFNTGWLQAEMITPVLVVVPLAFWAVSAAVTVRSWQRVLGASASLALALVAGNIVVFLVVVWVVALHAVGCWLLAAARRRPAAYLRRTALTLVLVGVGALALSAYSLVPTVLNLLSLSRRPAELEQVLPPQGSAGDILRSLWSAPSLDSSLALFSLHWCGRVALVLAVLGLLHQGGRRVLGAVLVVFFTLLPVTPVLVELGWWTVPPLRAVAGFGRLAFLGSFGLALLAASGTAVLIARAERLLAKARPAFSRALLLGPALGALAALAVVAELAPFARDVNPPWTDPGAALMPSTPAGDTLAATDDDTGWPGLVLPLSAIPEGATEPTGYALWGATAHALGLDSVGGYDSAVPTRATALTQVAQGAPVEAAFQPIAGAFLPNFGVGWSRLDLAERLGVTHVYAPPGLRLRESAYSGVLPKMSRVHAGADGQVWELDTPMRGPRLVADAVVATSPEDALTRFVSPEHDPRTTVVLEGPPDGIAPHRPAVGPPGEVRSARRGYDEVTVDVDVRRAGWLVMPIGFAPGWRAETDGEELAIRPADGAMSAVRLPPGRHTVDFSYRPRGFLAGAAVTLTSLLAVLALLVATRSSARRPVLRALSGATPRRKER